MFISTIPILLLISFFWMPFKISAQLRIENHPLLIRLFPPQELTILFVNDLGLIVFCPHEWSFLSQNTDTGAVPLLIYPPGYFKSEEDEYIFKNVIVVDIKPISCSFNLQELVKAEQNEVIKSFPNVKFRPEQQVISNLYGFRFITIAAEDCTSKLMMIFGFSRVGDKEIKIQLVSHPALYQEYIGKFFNVLFTLMPVKINRERNIIQPQAELLVWPPETSWRNRLLGDGPYEYWKNFEPGTEVKYKIIQKFSDYTIQSERAFQVLSVDQEAVVINYLEKVTQVSGQFSSNFSAALTEKVIEFIQAEEVFSQKDLFASRLGLDMGSILSDPSAIVVAENTDEFSVQDETLSCEQAVIFLNSQPHPKRLTIWYSEAVPGGLLKFTLEDLDETQFNLEATLISYSSKKRNSPIPPPEGSSEQETEEVPALSYLKQRLPLLWRGNTPLDYLTELSQILSIFALYYRNINLEPDEAVSRLQPILDEIHKVQREYNDFLTRAHEELTPKELNKITPFIVNCQQYMNFLSIREALIMQAISGSGARDRKKLETGKVDIKSFTAYLPESLMVMKSIKDILKFMAGVTLKIKNSGAPHFP